MHRGLPWSGLCSLKLRAFGPSGSSCSTLSSFEMSPPTRGPTYDDDARLLTT
jgi:hypothetical protein